MPNSHAITASVIAGSSGTATSKYKPRRKFTLRAFLSGVWLRHNDGSGGVGGKCHVVWMVSVINLVFLSLIFNNTPEL
ncbi:hypothetical protein D3C75_1331200 [compost metagenome]